MAFKETKSRYEVHMEFLLDHLSRRTVSPRGLQGRSVWIVFICPGNVGRRMWVERSVVPCTNRSGEPAFLQQEMFAVPVIAVIYPFL